MNRYIGGITPERELQWIRDVLSRPDERRFAILADGQYIGNVYLIGIKYGYGEISTFIGNKQYWNKGIGTIAKKLLLDYAFTKEGLKLVISRVRKENIASRRVNEKIGFKLFSKDSELVYYAIGRDTHYLG